MQRVLEVHIGEVKVAKKGELLKAILGSCVGIGIIWKEKKICGLAHCLLPESPTSTFTIGGRFVDQALRSLLALMKIRPESYCGVEAVIVGGGNMTNQGIKDNSTLVGATNFRVALREVKNLGIRIVHSDCGGEEGRRIFIDASNFSYRIDKIPKLIVAA